MKTLFQLCMQEVCKNLHHHNNIANLPSELKELFIGWLDSHELLADPHTSAVISAPNFGRNLSKIHFYLSDELTDELLMSLTASNNHLRQITIVHCSSVTDAGVQAVTGGQPNLIKLELRGLVRLTSHGLLNVRSDHLKWVDLSDCPHVCSAGILRLLNQNRNIQCLYLNHCRGLDDLALYAIGSNVSAALKTLEVDFPCNLLDPISAIGTLTESCQNLKQLSLCRFFNPDPDAEYLQLDCKLLCSNLKELDLYGNYFSVLPTLPKQLTSIRLSCSGSENAQDLCQKLQALDNLLAVRLMLICRENTTFNVLQTNRFLAYLLPRIGEKITGLQVQVYKVEDDVVRVIAFDCPNLSQLSVDAKQFSGRLLQPLLAQPSPANDYFDPFQWKSLKFTRIKLPYKLLLCLARSCRNLEELEISHNSFADDRVLLCAAENCPKLRSVNFNGCRFVSDKGICALARRCPLKEVRVRATAATDVCVRVLAQCCVDLEWIAHADYSGRPTFSHAALQHLRQSCVNRVIC